MSEQLALPLTPPEQPTIHALNTKAMTVRLTTTKPTTTMHLEDATDFVRRELGDAYLKVSGRVFAEKTNPVRAVLNYVTAAYAEHKQLTVPYIDRGPRLLPNSVYEEYRDKMRDNKAAIEKMIADLEHTYDGHVLHDIQVRNNAAVAQGKQPRASIDDYPSYEEFKRLTSINFYFAPLPDSKHFLFDINDEDKAALDGYMADVAGAVRADLYAKLRDPLKDLIEKLNVPAGEAGSIFRDTKVTNLTDNIALVRKLCMGDPTLEAMCDELDKATTGHARNPQVLRESPIVRAQAAVNLEAVAQRMAFMFGSP